MHESRYTRVAVQINLLL